MNQYIKQQFPYFKTGTYSYLDNAATTQVHATVIQAVADTLSFRGNPYRGSHDMARANQKKLELATERIASFITASAHEIVFTSNITHAINLTVSALAGVLHDGDEILLATIEHNSNLLPYLHLKESGAKIQNFGTANFTYDLVDLRSKLSERTKIVALQHVSNVTGVIQPIEAAINIIKKFNADIIVIVDGAQAVAHLPVDVKKLDCDVYAFSGHKMYGPDGIGVLYIHERLHESLLAVSVGGGTVVNILFEDNEMIPQYKGGLEKLKGGTPNLAAVVGLQKAIGMLRKLGWDDIRRHEQELKYFLIERLQEIDAIKMVVPVGESVGVVAFSLVDESKNQALAAYLNKNKVAIRFGSHCAFGLRENIGHDTLRVSFAVYNEMEEVIRLIELIKNFIAKTREANPEYERLKKIIFTQKEMIVDNKNQIEGYIKRLAGEADANVVVMAGHFLGIPDFEKNTFHPSIRPILDERLLGHLEEFGMTSFPLTTWDMGNSLVSELKSRRKSAKLLIVANETTGINELRLSSSNIDNKSADDYRTDLLKNFHKDGLMPGVYRDIMEDHGNAMNDLLFAGAHELCFRESILRDRFQKFIRRNKNYFQGMIDYTANQLGELDIHMSILNNPDIKTCSFESFQSTTGGKFCIAEVVELLAELFGKSKKIDYEYVPKKITNPQSSKQKNIFVIFSPSMCNNAVNRAAELYIKMFLQENTDKEFHFVNIPLGPGSREHLKRGTVMTHITNVVQ